MRFLLALFSLTLFVSADFIKDMEKNSKVIVIHGENAPDAEKKVAKDIFSALKLDEVDDLYDHIVTDTYALKHQFFYAEFILIIVGTSKTNKLCNTNAEIQYATSEKNQSPIRILPTA